MDANLTLKLNSQIIKEAKLYAKQSETNLSKLFIQSSSNSKLQPLISEKSNLPNNSSLPSSSNLPIS